MKSLPDRFVVVRYLGHDGELAYGPELLDRCEHWVKTVEHVGGPTDFYYEIHPALIGWEE